MPVIVCVRAYDDIERRQIHLYLCWFVRVRVSASLPLPLSVSVSVSVSAHVRFCVASVKVSLLEIVLGGAVVVRDLVAIIKDYASDRHQR